MRPAGQSSQVGGTSVVSIARPRSMARSVTISPWSWAVSRSEQRSTSDLCRTVQHCSCLSQVDSIRDVERGDTPEQDRHIIERGTKTDGYRGIRHRCCCRDCCIHIGTPDYRHRQILTATQLNTSWLCSSPYHLPPPGCESLSRSLAGGESWPNTCQCAFVRLRSRHDRRSPSRIALAPSLDQPTIS